MLVRLRLVIALWTKLSANTSKAFTKRLPGPPAAVLVPLVERLRSALESPIVVSGAAKRDQVSGLVGDAAGEVFAAPAAAVAARRLREMAFLYWRRDDAPKAGACLAGAASLEAEAGASPIARASRASNASSDDSPAYSR